MTPQTEHQINTLQEALEAEEQRLTDQLFHVRRTLEHLKSCRHEHRTGKPLHAWRVQVRMEEQSA